MGSSVGNYALFAGGGGSAANNTVDTYDNNLSHGVADPISIGKQYGAGAYTNSYALFAGGLLSGTGAVDTIDAYDESLVHTNPTTLSVARWYDVGVSVNGYAFFGGGYSTSPTTYYATVDVLDDSLTDQAISDLGFARDLLAGTSVGEYALFAGGSAATASSGYTAIVDAYSTNVYEINIPPLSKYFFEGITEEEQITYSGKSINGFEPLNGYISRGFILSGYNPESTQL